MTNDERIVTSPQQFEPPGRNRSEPEGMPALSKLEEALSAPEAQAQQVLAQAREQLQDLTHRTRQAVGQGTTRTAFSQLEALLIACDAAGEILDAAHPTGGHHERMRKV